MNRTRKLGVGLVVAGACLCSAYLVPTIYGSVMAHVAIAQFRARGASNSLWDSARIRAYQHTLSLSFAPPEAILRVPKVGIEVPVLEGTSDAAMNRGVGHVTGTALPGEPGNIAISGHRDGFFRGLKDVAEGDIVELERPAEAGKSGAQTGVQTDRYVVRKISVVFPSDTTVLNPATQASGSTLTLITCFPFYFVGAAPQRYIVQASLLPAQAPAARGASSSIQTIQNSSGD